MVSNLYLTLLALFLFQRCVLVGGVELSLCSSLNTGSDFKAEISDFQSFGACKDTCGDEYAFAIMQGKSCWCSDAAPGDTVSNDECTTKCGGYPDDKCGSIRDKLFAYYELSKTPSTTIGSPKSTSSTSAAASTTSLGPTSVTVTVTESPKKASDTLTTFSTQTTTSIPTSSPSPETSASPSVSTKNGNIVTITVPNEAPASTSPSGENSSSRKSESLDGGQVAGVIIGSLIGFAVIATLVIWYFCFYRRRQKKKEAINEYRDPFHQSPVPRPIFETTRNSRVPAMSTVSSTRAGDVSEPSVRLSVPAFTDNRMKRDLYSHGSRHSNISLQDHHDYTRPVLRLTNPDTPA